MAETPSFCADFRLAQVQVLSANRNRGGAHSACFPGAQHFFCFRPAHPEAVHAPVHKSQTPSPHWTAYHLRICTLVIWCLITASRLELLAAP